MRRYKVETPDQMKQAVMIMKDSEGVWNAHNVAQAWSVWDRKGVPNAFTVYVEIEAIPGVGQNANLYRQQGDTKIFLGRMYVMKARHFVKGLQEVEV